MIVKHPLGRALLATGLSVPLVIGFGLPALADDGQVSVVSVAEDPGTGRVTVAVETGALRSVTVSFPDGQEADSRAGLTGAAELTSDEDVMASGPITARLGDPDDESAPQDSIDFDDPGTVTVSVDPGDGTMDEPLSRDVEPGTEMPAPAADGLHREGHFLDVWEAPDGNRFEPGDSILVEDDLTITAVWAPRTDLAVSFRSADATFDELGLEDLTYGDEITLPAADDVDADGRRLRGWDDGSGTVLPPLSGATVVDDTVYTALWIPQRSGRRDQVDPPRDDDREDPPTSEEAAEPEQGSEAEGGPPRSEERDDPPSEPRTPRSGPPGEADSGTPDRRGGSDGSAGDQGSDGSESSGATGSRPGQGQGGRGRDLGESSSSDPRPGEDGDRGEEEATAAERTERGHATEAMEPSGGTRTGLLLILPGIGLLIAGAGILALTRRRGA